MASAPVHHSLIPRWLTHFGALGLFAVAVVDSSVIPLPLPGSTDLLLLWLVSHRGNPYLLVASALAGSVLGGYSCWTTGQRGGKAALERYVRASMLKRISVWVENHSVLSIFVPAMLPPPIPLLPFLIAAGALGISRKHFLISFSAARFVRFTILAWIGATYGRGIVRLWSRELDKWSAPLLWGFGVMVLGSVGFAIWQYRKQPRTKPIYTVDTPPLVERST